MEHGNWVSTNTTHRTINKTLTNICRPCINQPSVLPPWSLVWLCRPAACSMMSFSTITSFMSTTVWPCTGSMNGFSFNFRLPASSVQSMEPSCGHEQLVETIWTEGNECPGHTYKVPMTLVVAVADGAAAATRSVRVAIGRHHRLVARRSTAQLLLLGAEQITVRCVRDARLVRRVWRMPGAGFDCGKSQRTRYFSIWILCSCKWFYIIFWRGKY